MTNHIECTIDATAPDMRYLDIVVLHELFTTGRITLTDFNTKSVERLEVLDYICDDGGFYRLTRAGLKVAIDNYLSDVANGKIFGELIVDYFRCLVAPVGSSHDQPLIACSSEGVKNYVQLLKLNGNLSVVINDTNIFKLVDFIDEYTGESHLLYPDDTVVSNASGGYVIHKFSE